jgi:transcriptional regulator with XRE-family HTH domain
MTWNTKNRATDKPGSQAMVANGARSVLSLEGQRSNGQPGGALVSWLSHEANVRGHSLSEMAQALNVTYGYVSQLRSGARQAGRISDAFVASCARYLSCPVALVNLASGRLKPTDFLMPEDSAEQALEVALRRVQADPVFGALMPMDAFTASEEIQRFIVLCYQEASGQEIYPYRRLPDMLQQLQRAAEAAGESHKKPHGLVREV